MTELQTARIGMVNFINTAPLYETWKDTVRRDEWHVVEGSPAELNRQLSSGLLDLGFVSSHEYASEPSKYKLLPGLSISSCGPVGSVFLFSQTEPENLDGTTVFLSRQSQTSNSLVKILLEEFVGVRPYYCFPESEVVPVDEGKSVLAIGDIALRMKDSGRYEVVLDLGEIWYQYTGLPFVFAVWAVANEFAERNQDLLADIHGELLRCVTEGKENLPTICQRAAPRIPMSVEKCYEYLQAIEYDLNDKKIEALELFYKYLIERGEGKKDALPLRFAQTA
jgi:chorismate dehydratase